MFGWIFSSSSEEQKQEPYKFFKLDETIAFKEVQQVIARMDLTRDLEELNRKDRPKRYILTAYGKNEETLASVIGELVKNKKFQEAMKQAQATYDADNQEEKPKKRWWFFW